MAQWKHTVFNSVGTLVLGITPVLFFYGLINSSKDSALRIFNKSVFWKKIKGTSLEFVIVGVPTVLIILFNLEAIPFFDDPLAINAVMWETPLTLLLAYWLRKVVTRPMDTLFAKSLDL